MQHIICFGNLWQGDDGFGIHVFRRLKEVVLPESVRLFEAGVAGLNALTYFEGCRKAIIVDGLKSAGKVGSIHRLGMGDLSDPEPEFSLHNFGLNHLSGILSFYLSRTALPVLVVIGVVIVPDRRISDQLSPAVATSVDGAINRILEECTS
jgi:hydrogenase maturation protease